MTVTYHAGRRLQGLDADRTATQLPAGGVGGWVELGRATGTYTSLDITSLADKRYYMVLNSGLSWASGANSQIRFNGDSGTNYSFRDQRNGATDYTETSSTRALDYIGTGTENQLFAVNYIANRSANEKLGIAHSVIQNTAGSGTAPSRDEVVYKWANTSDPIDQIDYTSGNAHGASSEVVVLGWDPADTHTNNFWEELGSDTLSGAANDISVSFTAKKYIWFQYAVIGDTATSTYKLRLGNSTLDSGSNYAYRGSADGAADATATSQSSLDVFSNDPTANNIAYCNGFIINNSSNEKLIIYNSTLVTTAGAATAPTRRENTGKWVNTSNQCDILGFVRTAGSGQQGIGTTLKVWGSD